MQCIKASQYGSYTQLMCDPFEYELGVVSVGATMTICCWFYSAPFHCHMVGNRSYITSEWRPLDTDCIPFEKTNLCKQNVLAISTATLINIRWTERERICQLKSPTFDQFTRFSEMYANQLNQYLRGPMMNIAKRVLVLIHQANAEITFH